MMLRNIIKTGEKHEKNVIVVTAVAHSGLDINDVNFVKQKYDFDDGIQEWDIEFVHGTTKYEYAINAMTGAIIKFEMDSIYD